MLIVCDCNIRLYPKDYDEWLKYITENDCKYTLQLREEKTGKIQCEFQLSRKTWLKNGLDLVICHLEEEDEFVDTLNHKYDISIEPIEFVPFTGPESLPVVSIGHDFVKDDSGSDLFLPTRFVFLLH